MLLLTIIWILFAHFVSDFILQKHAWSLAKSTSNLALTKHVATYTTAMFLMSSIALGLIHGLIFASVQGITHWIIDYVTSRQTSRLYREERFHDFFVVIGFDQWLHVAVMLLTLLALGYN